MKFLLVAILFISSAMAVEIEVKMLNKGSDGKKMVFEPALIKVNVGDTVKFIPTSKGHSVESLKSKDSRPKGAIKIKSKRNKEYIYEVKNVGVHIFKCKPHYAMGMIGAIVAGSPVNIDVIKKLKIRGKKSKKRFEALIKKIQ